MKPGTLLRALLEWLTFGCFAFWCLFSYLSLAGTPRLPSALAESGLPFLSWFVAGWWGWIALIRSELEGPDDARHPAWVTAGLVAGVLCVLLAFWEVASGGMPSTSMSLGDAAATILLLLLFGFAPALLAADHLRRFMRRV